MKKNIDDFKNELKQLKFALSNTVDPLNVIHLEGQIKTIEGKINKLKSKKEETKEQTTAGSSGSFEGSLGGSPIKRKISSIPNVKKVQADEQTAVAGGGGGFDYDVPLFGKTSKGRRNPLKIEGPKSIKKARSVTDKNFPKWGGPKSVFIKIKEKCKKFPYCNQGDINAIEPLREAIENTSKKYGIPINEVENLVLNEIKRIFI